MNDANKRRTLTVEAEIKVNAQVTHSQLPKLADADLRSPFQLPLICICSSHQLLVLRFSANALGDTSASERTGQHINHNSPIGAALQ